jgi:hypothetical protein
LGGLKALDAVIVSTYGELPRNALNKVVKADLRARHRAGNGGQDGLTASDSKDAAGVS